MNVPSSCDWNPSSYQDRHSFVWRYGADLVDALNPQPHERILDLGCGTGQLTSQIAQHGACVIGLDKSRAMIAQARNNFPDLTFVEGDAAAFDFSEPFDTVFSNAALHWVKNAGGAVQSIAHALRTGGRFIAEFGGRGNIATIVDALQAVLGDKAAERSPWYYPSVGEYAPLLEQHGLGVQSAYLFYRPTQLEGEAGMDHWLRLFCPTFWHDSPPARIDEIVGRLVEHLRPSLYRDGVWTVDYRRLRVLAIRLT